jgi:arylsulfatase A-like enzyme
MLVRPYRLVSVASAVTAVPYTRRPYDRWPLGRGFERYYGSLGGDTHQYYPELVRDNSQTEPERPPRKAIT